MVSPISIVIKAKANSIDGLCVLERMLCQAFGVDPPPKGEGLEIDMSAEGIKHKLTKFRSAVEEYLSANLPTEFAEHEPGSAKTSRYADLMTESLQDLRASIIKDLQELQSEDIDVAKRSDALKAKVAWNMFFDQLWSRAGANMESVAMLAGDPMVDPDISVKLKYPRHLDLLEDTKFRQAMHDAVKFRSIFKSDQIAQYEFRELDEWFGLGIRLYVLEMNDETLSVPNESLDVMMGSLLRHIDRAANIAQFGNKRKEVEKFQDLKQSMRSFIDNASILYERKRDRLFHINDSDWEEKTDEEKLKDNKDRLLVLVKIMTDRADVRTIKALGKSFGVDTHASSQSLIDHPVPEYRSTVCSLCTDQGARFLSFLLSGLYCLLRPAMIIGRAAARLSPSGTLARVWRGRSRCRDSDVPLV